nr:endonuclease/exonuclease/phosphatase family protein [Variibacter gotjawalensis]
MDRGVDLCADIRITKAEARFVSVIRFATWNIHGGVGRDGRFDLTRVVELLKRAAPDVVALQEVDSRRAGPAQEHPFVFLRNALGPHGAEAKAITGADGDYGQLLISRWPLTNIRIHDISVAKNEPRRAIEADVEAPAGVVRVVATHLGLSFGERRRQTDTLVALAEQPAPVLVMMGDFNDWIWRGRVHSVMQRVLPGRTWVRTFPSRFPLIRLDRLHCRPREALGRSWTDPDASAISDHLPVFAEIRLPVGQAK